MVAAAFARRAGVWLAIGSVAALLGVVVVAGDSGVRARLRPSWRLILVGVAAAGCMVVVTYAASPLVHVVAWLENDLQRLYSAFGAAGRRTALMALGPVIVGEEVVWRGAVQGALEQRVSARAAAVLSAVVYALAHAPIGSPLLVLTALACGIVWAALRAVTGSLVPSIVSHALWDVVVLVAFPLVSR
jgi:membrane protease YdiL (CAAX protease family)